MSNLFTRKYYDAEELVKFDVSNKKKNNLVMDLNSRENKNGCNSGYGTGQGAGHISRPLNQEGFLDFSRKVDIENKLLNRHLELSSDLRGNRDYENVNVDEMRVCNTQEHLVNEDSRFKLPINKFRGMSTTELAFTPYLHMNPQRVHTENNKFMNPEGRMGESTRYNTKKGSFANTMAEYRQRAENRGAKFDQDEYANELKALLPKRMSRPK
jgi:hypothetical protein